MNRENNVEEEPQVQRFGWLGSLFTNTRNWISRILNPGERYIEQPTQRIEPTLEPNTTQGIEPDTVERVGMPVPVIPNVLEDFIRIIRLRMALQELIDRNREERRNQLFNQETGEQIHTDILPNHNNR